MSTKGNGKTIQWIRDHAAYPHADWCLIWPFSKTRGYGTFGYLGKHYYAHRFMCELAHGQAPSATHEAAHSCGDEGCVNPHHLSWKTPAENGLDSRQHGTHVRSRYGSVVGTLPELMRRMPSSLNDACRTLEAGADEIERLNGALNTLANGFEKARDRCTYAAEAQRLDNCAKFCRSSMTPALRTTPPADGNRT